MPRIADLVRAIETLGQGKAGNAEPDVRGLQIAPYAGGWFTARSGRLDSRNVSVFGHTNVSPVSQMDDAAPNNETLRVFEGDEFRFRELRTDRT